MANNIFIEILPNKQIELYNKLKEISWINNFYLASGTGLALQIKHRISVDFDFFTDSNIDTKQIISKLTEIGDFIRIYEESNTLSGLINGIKISFMSYKYPMIDEFIVDKNIKIANIKDIALMKIEAIAGRGAKKDFYDLYYIFQLLSINQLFELHQKKYGNSISNHFHLLKSMIYFKDAEEQDKPITLEKIKWQYIKKEIIKQVKNYKIL